MNGLSTADLDSSNRCDVDAYLAYCLEVRQNNIGTVHRRKGNLKHLLRWAGETPLAEAPSIRPTFPKYLAELTRKDGQPLLCYRTQAEACETTRLFFRWARDEYPDRYRRITPNWLERIRTGKNPKADVNEHEVFPLEDIRKILALQPQSLMEIRDQAALAFLFLSGMRISAFCTLPIIAVCVEKRQVRQLPSLGVHTKNSKAAITHLLHIPDLLEVVAAWDWRVRYELPYDGPWYPPLRTGPGSTLETRADLRALRKMMVYRGIQHLCERAGVPYHSPHKIRHSHATYALKLCRDMADYKAVSQNLMHSSISITDKIYSILSTEDVGSKIQALGAGGTGPGADNDTLRGLMEALLAKLASGQPERVAI